MLLNIQSKKSSFTILVKEDHLPCMFLLTFLLEPNPISGSSLGQYHPIKEHPINVWDHQNHYRLLSYHRYHSATSNQGHRPRYQLEKTHIQLYLDTYRSTWTHTTTSQIYTNLNSDNKQQRQINTRRKQENIQPILCARHPAKLAFFKLSQLAPCSFCHAAAGIQ